MSGNSPEPTYRERGLAALSHCWPLLWLEEYLIPIAIITPIVLIAWKGDYEIVRHHSVAVINAQLSYLLYGLALIALMLLTIGLAAIPGVLILAIVAIALLLASLFGVVDALSGAESFNYPFVLSLVR